jgi:hypothetical protein
MEHPMKKLPCAFGLSCCLAVLASAQALFPDAGLEATAAAHGRYEPPLAQFLKFQTVTFRAYDEGLVMSEDDIATLNFNRSTRWSAANAALAERILRKGASPGLGVGELHSGGITGKGVSIAIIDDLMPASHPEYAGKIATVETFGYGAEVGGGSMHGPAVASLLVGENLGTAPGARLHYFAASVEELDSIYHAQALERIIEINGGLPESERIRVVSVSAAPSGEGSPFERNLGMWDEAVAKAEAANILVLDCTNTHGFIFPGYCDLGRPDDPESFRAGFPNGKSRPTPDGYLCAPSSHRTIAEEYAKGEHSYAYNCRGGLSWAIPYVAGVCAMAWQVEPGITAAGMRKLLFDSARLTTEGVRVIDPVALVALAGGVAAEGKR